jgi:predicted DNA-binding transcriptional regulator YafY
VIDLIRRACWDERALDLGYRDVEGQASTRRIHPLALVYTDGALTMVAWCCLRLDYRMFRIDRIEALEATDEFFRPRRAALLREYLARLDALPTNPLDSSRRTG